MLKYVFLLFAYFNKNNFVNYHYILLILKDGMGEIGVKSLGKEPYGLSGGGKLERPEEGDGSIGVWEWIVSLSLSFKVKRGICMDLTSFSTCCPLIGLSISTMVPCWVSNAT